MLLPLLRRRRCRKFCNDLGLCSFKHWQKVILIVIRPTRAIYRAHSVIAKTGT
jgi:hypothetical protein